MGKKLVIVESPAKARTVGKFLGSGYSVKASVGHIRDLPQNRLGVNVEDDFTPRYVIPEKKKAVVRGLKTEVKEVDEVYLATDPDREGEAIAWHLAQALKVKKKPVYRVEFHEITKNAIDDAFSHPREINQRLVDAQQARRILDRLVGYTLSPLLRSKIYKKGLSAGRVQSVAVRLVVEREREVQAFNPVEYWSIDAELAKKITEGKRKKPQAFKAALTLVRGEKLDINKSALAHSITDDLNGAVYQVTEVRKKEVQRNPAPPFTTSTLQQESSRKIGFTAKRTMAVAQQLYEGVSLGADSVGLITYMRTDSTNLAESAVEQAREFIGTRYGPDYVPAKPRVYKTKSKGAQEAHEAIRPTDMSREPEAIKSFLSPEQFKLYRLVWQRAVACQMSSAVMDSTSVDIGAGPEEGDKPYMFRATGSVVKFPGFTIVYTEGKDEGQPTEEEEEEGGKKLPTLTENELLDLVQLSPEQHFTQPPPRYTEATLVKALEENGIGRPSTYAPTIAAIQDRGYVERTDKKLAPTEIGIIVNDLLVEHFPEIVDLGFTAGMEENLDKIAQGESEWVPVLRSFYGPFEISLEAAARNMQTIELKPEDTGELCEKCGSPLLIKYGRFGKFIACSGYPKCRNAKSLAIKVGVKCPECGGEMVEKKTRRKRIFYSCDKYPTCSFAVWQKPVPTPCPACGGLMTANGPRGIKCSKCGEEVQPEEKVEAAALA